MALLKRSDRTPGRPAPNASLPSRETLVAILRSAATQTERRAAAQDLASSCAAAQELAAALPDEREHCVQAAILAALVSIGTDDAAAGVADAVVTEDALLRNAAVDALRAFGAKALPQIERLLASPHAELRIVGVGLLEAREALRARTLLHKILADDPELNVGLAAVEVLSLIGNPGDAAALRGFGARFAGNSFVAFAVELACRRAATGEPA